MTKRALVVALALAGCKMAAEKHTQQLPPGTLCGGYKGAVKTCVLGARVWVCTDAGCVELARAQP